MAKNLKLQIKNTQLADAINLRGLKEKLSRKKEPHVEAEEHQEKEELKKKPLKKKSAPLKEEPSHEQPSHEKPLQEQYVQEQHVHEQHVQEKPLHEKPVHEKPVHEKPVHDEPLHEEPHVRKKAPKIEEEEKSLKKKPFKKKASTEEVVEEKGAEVSLKKEEVLHEVIAPKVEIVQEKAIQEKVIHEIKQEEKVGPVAPPTPKKPPVFLSASRENPHGLGPVIGKELPRAQERKRQEPTRQEDTRRHEARREHERPEGRTYEPFRDRPPRTRPPEGAKLPPPPAGAPQQPSGFQQRGQPYQGQRREFQPRDSQPREYQPRDSQPRDSQPRDSQPREHQPRDSQPREYQSREFRPREYQPRDSQPREYQPREFRPRDSQPREFQPRSDDRRPQGFQGGRPPQDQRFQQGPRPPFQPGSRPPFQPGSRPPFQSGAQGGQFRGPPFRDRQEGFRPQPFAQRDRTRPPRAKDVPLKEIPDEERSTKRQFFEIEKQKPKVAKERPVIKKGESKGFDSRVRHGFQVPEDEEGNSWRRRKAKAAKVFLQQEPTRPTKIKVRIPISIKDLAQEMKLKASQLISTLFLQGVIVTLNDMLEDETAIQLLGHEFGCEVSIDTQEEERIRITSKSINDEIKGQENLVTKPPVVAFMGHVDHGKTSLIDAIRKTNRAGQEVGAITQHIGAFMCNTSHGPITILDTPGHEAFAQMRERGASLTDIVVLVIAGDEGMQEQTYEALKQAKEAKATIVVAITKCDKPAFDKDLIFRQLADKELLPEAWGGQTVTIACSAVTHEGIQELLEMLALQAEVLELQANPSMRARGTVIESQVVKGLGPVATLLVQNGSLHAGDCLVFASTWAKVKSMRDDEGNEMQEAAPSVPVRIHGLSDLPCAGEEFVVVKNEKEAKNIAEERLEGKRQSGFMTKRRLSVESMMEKAKNTIPKKVLNLILRADVQGSLEALKTALMKIESQKVSVDILSEEVGEISESDVQLASISHAIIVGFHTGVESHAEPMTRALGVKVLLFDIIYHAQDEVKALMKSLLDKIAQENERGKAEVKALFKSSHLGIIAGCLVQDGSISRNSSIRVKREGNLLWTGSISSLKRFKDDVKEVSKGTECGIVLSGFSELQPGDILEAFDVTYLTQEL